MTAFKSKTFALTKSPHGQAEIFTGMTRRASTYWRKQWYFRVRARNGQILLTSEGYNQKASAKKCYVAALMFFNS